MAYDGDQLKQVPLNLAPNDDVPPPTILPAAEEEVELPAPPPKPPAIDNSEAEEALKAHREALEAQNN